MDVLATLWNFVMPFLVVFTVVVFVHEMGHYLVARRCGVRVEEFAVGFGRELAGWTDRRGTRWKICVLPLGGFVRMRGEMHPRARAAREGEAGPAEDSFEAKSVGQRACVAAAGPLANFLLAIAVFACLFATVGLTFTPPRVGEVVAGSAAERAGFRPGDLISRVDGTRVERFEEVAHAVRLRPATELEFEVIRDGREIVLTAVPDSVDRIDRFGNPVRVGRLGVASAGAETARRRDGPLAALWRATVETAALTGDILVTFGQLVDGRRTLEELGGPLRIAKISGDVWQLGLFGILTFVAVLSINLGLINLLPIPLLDGGHLLFYAIEALRGRPLGARAQACGLRIGMALVLALMVFATWNDLVQLRVVDFLVGWAT